MQEFKIGQKVKVHAGFNHESYSKFIGREATIVKIDNTYINQPCIMVLIEGVRIWTYPCFETGRKFDVEIINEKKEKMHKEGKPLIAGSLHLKKAFVAEMLEEGHTISETNTIDHGTIEHYDRCLPLKYLTPSEYHINAFTSTYYEDYENIFYLPLSWYEAKEAIKEYFRKKEEEKKKSIDVGLQYVNLENEKEILVVTLGKDKISAECQRIFTIEEAKKLIDAIKKCRCM